MAWYSGKRGGEGLWGWPWAEGGGGGRLPLLCPPPRVKAKVIPQPLGGWAGRRGGSGQTKNWSPGELGAGGTHLGPGQSWLREGQQAPPGPALTLWMALPPICTNPYGSQSHTDLPAWAGSDGGGGKLRPREERQPRPRVLSAVPESRPSLLFLLREDIFLSCRSLPRSGEVW